MSKVNILLFPGVIDVTKATQVQNTVKLEISQRSDDDKNILVLTVNFIILNNFTTNSGKTIHTFDQIDIHTTNQTAIIDIVQDDKNLQDVIVIVIDIENDSTGTKIKTVENLAKND